MVGVISAMLETKARTTIDNMQIFRLSTFTGSSYWPMAIIEHRQQKGSGVEFDQQYQSVQTATEKPPVLYLHIFLCGANEVR